MPDIEKICNLIAEVEKYIRELEGYSIKKEEDIMDSKTYHASSMVVFALLNKTIDLGTELLFSEQLGAPSRYIDIMPILAKAGIMNKKQADELNSLIKKRNVLAHFYDSMSEKELYKTIRDIYLIKEFIILVKKRISSRKDEAN